MKFLLVFILSLIVLGETITPCCVWDSCAQETTTSNSKKDKGECSPFTASCSTCTAGVILAQTTAPEFSIAISPVKHIAAYQSMRATPYTRSLLQPPRLG